MGFDPPNTYTGQSQTQNKHWLINLKDVVMTLRVWPGFGSIANGVRIYSANDYQNGFIAMILFSILAMAAAFRVRETYCRNSFKE